jgi:hypothetical protein
MVDTMIPPAEDTANTGVTDAQKRLETGLVSMLDQDNEVMKLSRKQGAREGAAKGLGNSSYSARAAQGAAMEYATPLVSEAVKMQSGEDEAQKTRDLQTSMQDKEIAAGVETQQRDIISSEGMQQAGIAADTATQQRTITSQEAMQVQDIVAAEAAQGRDITAQQALQQLDIAAAATRQQTDIDSRTALATSEQNFRAATQQTDIEYKEWLEETTFGHEKLLEGNRQASDAFRSYLEAQTSIYTVPDTSAAQKEAASEALKTGFRENLALLETTTGIDLGQFTP